MEIASLVIGLIGGLVLSFALWFGTIHIFGPRILFSDGISQIRDLGGAVFRVKITNARGSRGVIDVQARAVAILPGLFDDRGNPFVTEVPLVSTARMRIGPKGNAIFWIQPQFLDFERKYEIPNSVAQMLIARDVESLSNLLATSSEGRLRFSVLATDQWTSSRKYFSKEYAIEDIWPDSRFFGLKMTRPIGDEV